MLLTERPVLVSFAAMGLLLALAGAFVIRAEMMTYFATGNTIRRLEVLSEAPPSIQSQEDLLLECQRTLERWETLEMRFEGETVRQAVAENCLAVADTIVKSAPTFALASLVGANASARLSDWQEMSARLVQSQATSPSEQWLAESRVTLGERYLNHLSVEARDAHDKDLRLLALSQLGVQSIAARYVRDVDFRERIIVILETTTPGQQRRFISNVRRLMEGQISDD